MKIQLKRLCISNSCQGQLVEVGYNLKMYKTAFNFLLRLCHESFIGAIAYSNVDLTRNYSNVNRYLELAVLLQQANPS